MGLTIWVRRFENLVDGWRKKESNEDFRCKHGSPFCEINNELIKHAKRAYTINMFARFKIQYILMLEMTWKELDSDGSTTMYEVKGEEIDENEPSVIKSKRRAKVSKGDNIKVRTVIFDKAKSFICCTCKMFETEGILCRHTLKILSLQNFTKISESYILKRWTKEAKSMEVFSVSKGTTSDNIEKQVFSSSRFQSACNVILKASETETTKAIWDDGLRKIMLDIDKELGCMKLIEDHSDEIHPPLEKDRYDENGCADVILVKNPSKVRTKGAP
ncbi:hypothetical protein RND81_12G105300 [Saponaria officinalis]|uniref:Protein FAR1-RELATED SEQUENCE n=1 Tax=Saponaria officinalis TaxID=3572 RepID=A0AAW1H8Y8_SAPOF